MSAPELAKWVKQPEKVEGQARKHNQKQQSGIAGKAGGMRGYW